jgi:hypothetical protein
MKKLYSTLLPVILVLFFLPSGLSAKKNPESNNSNAQPHNTPVNNKALAGCSSSTSIASLDISNVRTLILLNGDMWWDAISQTNVAEYEVPKGSGKTSLFAGSFWIGGLDAGLNLHVAAQTYRQTGTDFYPGPLDTTTAAVTPTTCLAYDRHFVITRQEVLDFIGGSPATPAITNWPGNGTGAQAHYLAPFYDNNGDGIYNPADGDYPKFDYIGSSGGDCTGALHGDQAIWFVFNDMGNPHTETGGLEFGIEIQEQAFAYQSAIADINNSTFYQYRLINRNPTGSYNNVYIGMWIDPDLGNAVDDYVGCDVKRGLGYCYNGDENDEGTQGYGINPPAVGVDFLQGPLADAFDGIDNDRDSIIDEPGEQIIMSKFVYYNNDASAQGNPTAAADYYNYLKGIWIDNTNITFGGNGNSGSDNANFMFPGTSDPYGWSTNGVITQANSPSSWTWSEETAGNVPGDRRFLQSAGPFTFVPGEVQLITTAAMWARAVSGGRLASINYLKNADDNIQLLMDSCFNIVPVIHPLDAGMAGIVAPSDTLCDSVLTPTVRLENYGVTTLTNVTINYQLDGNPVQSVPWNGSLPQLSTVDIILAPITTTVGTHTFSAYTTSPNGNPDNYSFNDTASSSFFIRTSAVTPVMEGFESATFPPAPWSVSGTAAFLLRATAAGGFGNSPSSMEARSFFLGNANTDFSTTVMANTSIPAQLAFDLAYSRRTDTSQDTIQVFVSSDCGQSFSLAYSKTGSAMATTANHTTNYTPLASEWRTEIINLSPYLGQPTLQIKFHFHSGNSSHRGNNMYVDNINLSGTVDLTEINSRDWVKVYPNPMHDYFKIQLNVLPKNARIEIFSIAGNKVYEASLNQKELIVQTGNFSSGIYFVRVNDGERVFTRKLVIE